MCVECGARPRRPGAYRNGAVVSWSRRCSSCDWRKVKADAPRYARRKAGNRVASARFRRTPKRRVALDRHAQKAVRRGKTRAVIYACLLPEEWVSLYKAQGDGCAICRCPLVNRYDPGPQNPDAKIASLDHSHAREKELLAEGATPRDALRGSVRGLLCYYCNRNVLGVALRDSAEKAQNAADYLRDPPARKVIQCS